MKLHRLAVALSTLLAPVAAAAQPVSPAIKHDHFGYRPADAKVAIFTANPGATVQIRDAVTLAVVFTIPTNGGSIVAKGVDGPSSLDTVWWVDFAPFATLGTYHLFSPAIGGKSYDFTVRGDVHRGVLGAALKSYYRPSAATLRSTRRTPARGPIPWPATWAMSPCRRKSGTPTTACAT